MNRYAIYKFDWETYVVFDRFRKREICVCARYQEDGIDHHARAKTITRLLNQQDKKSALGTQP